MDFGYMCPRYERAVQVLGKRWTGLIIRSLMDGPRRFTDIRTYVCGLSDRLLSERLQELELEGIVGRAVHDRRPVSVQYSLTAKGADLRMVVEAIQTWADRWVALEGAPAQSPPAGVYVQRRPPDR